jgi:hypothetical protein
VSVAAGGFAPPSTKVVLVSVAVVG